MLGNPPPLIVASSGEERRLPPPAGVRSVRRREEDPRHVSAEGAVRGWRGQTEDRTPALRGEPRPGTVWPSEVASGD